LKRRLAAKAEVRKRGMEELYMYYRLEEAS
jgi:hypothetical protein